MATKLVVFLVLIAFAQADFMSMIEKLMPQWGSIAGGFTKPVSGIADKIKEMIPLVGSNNGDLTKPISGMVDKIKEMIPMVSTNIDAQTELDNESNFNGTDIVPETNFTAINPPPMG